MSSLHSLRLMSLARSVVLATSFAALAATQAPAQTASGEPVTIGVSGPLTGQNAQYGAQWKKASILLWKRRTQREA
jgi:branched-chain amino acid transport system substrate-binding protein